jgi:HEPN domain-containing protein
MDGDFLKRRAKEFYQLAKRNFKEGFYNICVFEAEQACQLFLKYLLQKRAGDFPKTHFITTLIEELAKAYNKEEIKEFLRERSTSIQALESVYLSSRYLGKEFKREEAKALLNFAKELITFLSHLSNEKLL